jgi:hypothetical protein
VYQIREKTELGMKSREPKASLWLEDRCLAYINLRLGKGVRVGQVKEENNPYQD